MKTSRPRIDVNIYKTPTTGYPDGVSCAVLNLSPDEAKIIAGLAARISAERNSTKSVSALVSWMPENATLGGVSKSPDTALEYPPMLPVSVPNSEAGTRMGWLKRYNTPMWRTEYISPNGVTYIEAPGSRDMIMRVDDDQDAALLRTDVTKVEPKIEQPEAIDRFSGLDLT